MRNSGLIGLVALAGLAGPFFGPVSSNTVLAVTTLAGSNLAANDEAKQLLTDAASAIKSAKALSFNLKAGTEGFGGLVYGGEGTVLWQRSDDGKTRTLLKGQTEMPTQGKRDFHVAIGYGADPAAKVVPVVWIDKDAKTVWEGSNTPRSDASKVITNSRNMLFPEPLTEAEPFRREMAAQRYELLESKPIDGEPCDVIRVVMDEGKLERMVYLGSKDKILRRYEQVRIEGAKRMVRYWELSKVDAAPALTDASFEVATPEGFKREKAPEPAVTPAAKPTNPANPAMNTPAAPGGVAAGGLSVGSPMPAWSAKPVSEPGVPAQTIDSASLKGKVAVLGFWGPTFPASARVVAAMESLQRQYAEKGVAIWGVASRTQTNGESSEEAENGVREFHKSFGLTFKSLMGDDRMLNTLNVRGFPSVAVIDAAGNVSAFLEGSATEADIKAAIDAALAK
jgi:hypothetical protein